MIPREHYIQAILPFVDKPFVKIISGLRRSGKSSILLLLKEWLLEKGHAQACIIHVNMESFNFSHISKGEELYAYVKAQIIPDQRNYLLLDEVQEIEGWEKAVNACLLDFDSDIYLTGSNSRLLSSELATFLAGRYVEFSVYTLSFRESLLFHKQQIPGGEQNRIQAFMHYLRLGGFPVLHTGNYPHEVAYKVVYDIYSSVILRDTIQRHKIRDIELLERVIKYAMDNIGSTFSGKNVADYFKSQQRKLDINTIYNYLQALESAFILYRASRYDIKGREILKTQEKFYVGDTALVYAVMGYKDQMIAGMLENIVFLELKRRGYTVYIGKLGVKEIDFVGEKGGNKIYIQVAYKLESQTTVDREFTPLLAIPDQFPKYVVTLDEFWKESVNGVRHELIPDFLLMEW